MAKTLRFALAVVTATTILALAGCDHSEASGDAVDGQIVKVAQATRADATAQASAEVAAVTKAGGDVVASAQASKRVQAIAQHQDHPTDAELMAAYCEDNIGTYLSAAGETEQRAVANGNSLQQAFWSKEIAGSTDRLNRVKHYLDPKILNYVTAGDATAVALLNTAKQRSNEDQQQWGKLIGVTPPDALAAKIQSSPALQELQQRFHACKTLKWLPHS